MVDHVPLTPASLARPLAVMTAALAPTGLLLYYLAVPEANASLNIPLEHFVVTSNVSLVALAVGLLVARSALQLRHFPSLLLALGFICLAAIFAVHGLSTPGVLQRGEREGDAGLVVGVSGQLAL
ncbi:MAG: hypothetical protein FJ034_01220, partial [Chloroflexi bacterium]|nr:hypothetical protein [Chloroflexota bacterium]